MSRKYNIFYTTLLIILNFLSANIYAGDTVIKAFYYNIKPLSNRVNVTDCKNFFKKMNHTMTEKSIIKNYLIAQSYHFSKYNTLSLAIRKKPLTVNAHGKTIELPVYNAMVDVVGNGDNHGYGVVTIGNLCSGKYYMAG